jgi:acetoacetate decarboxylase
MSAKYGRLQPEDWGPFMPAHNSTSDRGPWYYRDTESVVIQFLLDEDAALDVLPSDLELVEPASGFIVIETNHRTTLGPYSEVYNAILCTYGGETYGYVPGVYVTAENSLVVGRETYGFGKKLAHRIELTHIGNGTVEAAVDVLPGDGAVRATIRPSTNLPPEALASLPLICLRIVPDAEGGDKPALAQLVSVLFEANPVVGSDGKAEVYGGRTHLEYGAPSDVNVPFTDIVDAVYARFHADLPYGKVLKTF